MSGVITSTAARAALDYMTGKQLDLGTAPQTMQLALLTAAPSADPTVAQLNEVSATGYARQNVAWSAASTATPGLPSSISNSANLLYGPFTDVGGLGFPATHCALIGTVSGTPTVLMTWQFDNAGQASQNESLQISVGSLSMSLG